MSSLPRIAMATFAVFSIGLNYYMISYGLTDRRPIFSQSRDYRTMAHPIKKVFWLASDQPRHNNNMIEFLERYGLEGEEGLGPDPLQRESVVETELPDVVRTTSRTCN